MFRRRFLSTRIEQIKKLSPAVLSLTGLIVIFAAKFPVALAGEETETRKKTMLADIGMELDLARIKPAALRPEALEEVAQSMMELMREGVPSEQESAAHFLWGEIRYEMGDLDGAAEYYKKSEKSGRREAHADDAAFAYIAALEAAGRDEEAAREWIKWEKKNHSSSLLPEVLLARAWNALRLDSLSMASGLIDELRTSFPYMIDDQRTKLAAATLYYLDGRPMDALEELKSIKGDAPMTGSRGTSVLSINIEAPATYLRALCHEANGEKLQAAAQFQEIVDRHPESTLRDHAMLAKADIFLMSRAYKSAAEEYARVTQLAELLEIRAEAELRRAASVVLDDDAAGGTLLLQETVAHHPGTIVGARAQYLLGEVLLSQSQYEDAILEFNRVLTDYFEHSLAASAQYRVGRCLDALGRQIEATSSYQAVVSGYPLSPESPAAAYLAGVGLLAQKLPLAAAPYFQLVLDRYARDETGGMLVFASTEHQELVEASLCLLELSYHRAGNLGQLSGVPHLMLQKMPPSKSLWRAYALLIDADALAAQARYAEAQTILDQLISEFPRQRIGVSANRLLAWTYAQEGRDDLAMETEAQMLSLYSSYGDAEDMSSAYLNKGHILFNQKKYKDAAATYEEFLQRFPSHPEKQLGLYQAGLSYLRLGRTGNAVDKWEEVVVSDSTSEIAERAWVRAGDLYFQTEHYADAKRCYQGLLDHFSNSRVAAMAMLRLGQCEYNAGNDREALKHFSDLEARFPDSHVASAAKSGIEQSLFRLGQREDGSEVLAELVENYPTSSFAADAQFEIAMRHYEGKRFEEAAEAFRRVVSQFPAYASADRAHFLMAESYGQNGSSREARLAYEQFLMFFPGSELYTTVRFRLGSLRFVENDYMRAAVDFTSVLSASGISKEMASASLYNLALCRQMMGETEEAQTLLERYRQEYPSGDERAADVAYQLGDIHDKAGQTKLAVTEFAKALAAKPRTDLAVEIHYRIGACREQLSEDDQAINAYRKAMAAGAKDDAFRLSALVRCAALYEKKGSYDKALSAYQDLIRNAKDPELLVAAKERISQLEVNGN
jgi:TolA-binding protein